MLKAISFAAALIVATISVPAVLGAESAAEINQMQTEMLYTTVRVTSGGGMGSGTIIYSRNRFSSVRTYILTNYHVVQRNVSIRTTTSDGIRTTTETRKPVEIDIFLPSDLGSGFRIETATATIVAFDKYRDLAILLLDNAETKMSYVAAIADEGEAPDVFERAFAVGAGLGLVPFPTEGRISIKESILDHLPYIVASANIIFGNSGGGLYVWDETRYELVGVPSKIRVIGLGAVVSHVALSIPMDSVYYFLRSANLGFIIEAWVETPPDNDPRPSGQANPFTGEGLL